MFYIRELILFSILFQLVWSISRKELIDFAEKQYTKATKTTETGLQFPDRAHPDADHWDMCKGTGWFQLGMYPGVLWYLYHYTGKDSWKGLAIKGTDGLQMKQDLTSTHDIGFIIDNSYGRAYDFTRNKTYEKVLVNAAHHLATRYNSVVGCIRSWNSNTKEAGHFKVIVDNMMNLELLFRGHALSGNETLYDMAVSHANKTIENHIRKDYSTWHVVECNETTGALIRKHTAQGYSDSSCWSQGHAWAIYGFMRTYSYTKMEHYLETARHLADYYIEHLPEDGIAPWDFDVPKDKYPYIPRDSSAAACSATGLFRLYETTKVDKYLTTAKKIMDSLSSPKYRADGKKEYKIPALIVNGTIQGPNASPGHYDMALSYGDFYFMEALQFLQ